MKSRYYKEGDRVEEGWLVLQVKSFKDPRNGDREMFPCTHVDGARYNAGEIFQCNPEDAQLLIDAEQVEILQGNGNDQSRPKRKTRKAASESSE